MSKLAMPANPSTRSAAYGKPSGCGCQPDWPCGGSPRKATRCRIPWSQYFRAMSRISPREAPTHVRCGAPTNEVSRRIRVTRKKERTQEEPTTPKETNTKRSDNGASRSTDFHRIASIAASPGGKNSKDTLIGTPIAKLVVFMTDLPTPHPLCLFFATHRVLVLFLLF